LVSDGVVNDVPVPNELPPTASSYQESIPPDVEAPKLTVPFPDRAPLVTVTTGIAVIVAITAVLLAVVHPLSVAST
jgi:hypothetical protein